MAEYRIVRDNYCGFEVQIRRWWWPFWCQADFSNTHSSIEAAEQWAKVHAASHVKYLGNLSEQKGRPHV